MLPGFETRENIENEITRLATDAMNYEEIGSQYPRPNRYLGMAARIRTVLLPQLHQLLNSEEYE